MNLLVAAAVLVAGTSAAQAAPTTPSCLAKKLKEWGKLRKCQAGENAKVLQLKPADLGKCQTKFADKLGKITAQAAAAGVPCRYDDNGDGTVTDYDTGLVWEQKTDDGGLHDKDNTYSWSTGFPWMPSGTAFTIFLGGLNDGSGDVTTSGCFSGQCDWRLPLIEELQQILLFYYP